jgi:hypothetical protein
VQVNILNEWLPAGYFGKMLFTAKQLKPFMVKYFGLFYFLSRIGRYIGVKSNESIDGSPNLSKTSHLKFRRKCLNSCKPFDGGVWLNKKYPKQPAECGFHTINFIPKSHQMTGLDFRFVFTAVFYT